MVPSGRIYREKPADKAKTGPCRELMPYNRETGYVKLGLQPKDNRFINGTLLNILMFARIDKLVMKEPSPSENHTAWLSISMMQL